MRGTTPEVAMLADVIETFSAISSVYQGVTVTYVLGLRHSLKVEECNEPSCEALISPYGVVLFNIFSTICI